MRTHAVLSLATLALSPLVQAVGVVGNVEEISAPAGIRQGDLESNDHGHLFLEQSNYQLSHRLRVNAWAPGLYNEASDLGSRFIPSNAVVDSWFLSMDRVGTMGHEKYHGAITFDQPILGVIARRHDLDVSDLALGAVSTLYPTGPGLSGARDFELRDHEWFAISPDRHTLLFRDGVSSRMDQLRIITGAEPVPEPASLFALAVGGAAMLRGKRKAN